MYFSPNQPTAASDSSKQINICQSPELRNLKSRHGVVAGDSRLVSLRLTKWGKCSRAEVDIVHTYTYTLHSSQHVSRFTWSRFHLRRCFLVISHGLLSKATHTDTDTWRKSSPTWAASRASSSVRGIFPAPRAQFWIRHASVQTHSTWDY